MSLGGICVRQNGKGVEGAKVIQSCRRGAALARLYSIFFLLWIKTVARYGLARLVAARHAIWRLRRAGSQQSENVAPNTDTDSYVTKETKCF